MFFILCPIKRTVKDALRIANCFYQHISVIICKICKDIIWILTQQLTHAMEKDGVVGVAKIVSGMMTSEPEHAKALAYRLFTIAERKGWAQEAYAYNSLVIAWPEVQSKAAEIQAQQSNTEQMTIFESESEVK